MSISPRVLNSYEESFVASVPEQAQEMLAQLWSRQREQHETPPWHHYLSLPWPLALSLVLLFDQKEESAIFITWLAMAYFFLLPITHCSRVFVNRDKIEEVLRFEPVLIWKADTGSFATLGNLMTLILILALCNVGAFRTAGVLTFVYIVYNGLRIQTVDIVQSAFEHPSRYFHGKTA